MSTPCIITVAITGSVPQKSDNPAVPMSHAALPELIRSPASLRHSPEVLGMAHCLDSPDQSPRPFGAYCFKLNFTSTSVIANAIAHPNDNEFNPILYTAGPNVTGQFTKDKNGRGVECPAGFQHAPW
jgi:hypothetical protein